MQEVATLKGLKCPNCQSDQLIVTGTKGALGKAAATGLAFGAVGNLVAGKNAAGNVATEPLQYKCGNCGTKFQSMPLSAPPQEILSSPCHVTFIRESSFVGAAVPQIVYLNGVKIGPVKNGKSLAFTTSNRYNVLFVTDQFGVAFKSDYRFEASPGGHITVRFNRKFLDASQTIFPDSSSASLPASDNQVAHFSDMPHHGANTASLPPVRFCTACGNTLVEGKQFCTKCGGRRFDPSSELYSEPSMTTTSAGASAINLPMTTNPVAEMLMLGDPKPHRAMIAFGLLVASWFLLLILQGISGGRLLFSTHITLGLVEAVFGTSLYLLLQQEWKYKLWGIGGGIVTSLLFSWSSLVPIVSIATPVRLNLLNVLRGISHPLFASTWLRSIIIISLSMALSCGIWVLAKNREQRSKLRLVAWLGGISYALFPIIWFLIRRSHELRLWRSPNYLFSVAGFIFSVLLVYFSIRGLDILCRQNRTHVKLYGAGLVWAWIATFGMLFSLVYTILLALKPSRSLNFTATLLMALVALTGYVLLLCKRRMGLYLIVAATTLVLSGQFYEGLTAALFYARVHNARGISLMLVSLFGSVNPLLAWLSVRAADKRHGSSSPIVNHATGPKHISGFQKFASIFNIVAGGLVLLGLVVSLLFEKSPTEFIVVTTSFALIVLPFGIAITAKQHSKSGNYPQWMKVVNIIIFSIAVLFFAIGIIGFITNLSSSHR